MSPKVLGRMNLFKLLVLGTFICICCALGLAIHLLNRGVPSRPNTGTASDELEKFNHPRNIHPAFLKKQHDLQGKIKELNQSVTNLTADKFVHGFHNKKDETVNRKNPEMSANNNDTEIKGDKEVAHRDFETDLPSYNVHAFYYPWYGNPENDGEYIHWNHEYIQHWNKNEAKKWKSGEHKPPDDIGSNYYPALGAYSSKDPAVIEQHMAMFRYAKIGVVVVSWYPPGDGDRLTMQPDKLVPVLLDKADKFKLKVAIHVEPYQNRNQHTMKENIRYILKQYGSHPAFYRTGHGQKKNLPLFYIYDSYLVKSQDWAEIFMSGGKHSIRDTELDGIFIGLLVEQNHKTELVTAGFDGFYTYFATNGFTYGSSWKTWPESSKFAMSNNMLFIPSVGPGYIDTEVRPWNGKNTRKRLDGKYYIESFDNAIKSGAKIVSITSFNEWHEGTQIESAVKKEVVGRNYLDYGNHGEMFYLNLTRQWVQKFSSNPVT